jgi:hypothetical protein
VQTPPPTEQVLDLATDELARMVSRLRSIGGPRLGTASVPPFATRADAVQHLVRELVEISGDSVQHGFPKRLEDALLGDQLAVVGADALQALGSRVAEAADESLFILGEIVLHRFDVDGSLPGGAVARVLGDGDLATRLRARCPV